MRAGLRPPPKLHVQVSCMQLSRRLSDAGMQEALFEEVANGSSEFMAALAKQHGYRGVGFF